MASARVILAVHAYKQTSILPIGGKAVSEIKESGARSRPRRIEKDAVAILDRRDIFVRDAGHYLVQSMSVDDVYCSIRHAGGLWTVHAQVASKFMPETACRS